MRRRGETEKPLRLDEGREARSARDDGAEGSEVSHETELMRLKFGCEVKVKILLGAMSSRMGVGQRRSQAGRRS